MAFSCESHSDDGLLHLTKRCITLQQLETWSSIYRLKIIIESCKITGGQSASANGFLAVTGSYGVGTSVLYLIDTENRQLAVYEARGGSEAQRRIVLVGARRIDLDLMLEKYNDRSEYDYRQLRAMFESRGSGDPDVSTGLERSSDGKK